MKRILQIALGVIVALIAVGCATTTVETEWPEQQIAAALERHINISLSTKADAGKFYSKYLIPSDEELKRIAGIPLTAEELAKVRAMAESITRKAERTIVWPKWIASIKAKSFPVAEKFLAAGDYDNARETIWRASTTEVPDVDNGVKKFGDEFLNTRVNPAQWKIIEKQMRDKALDCAKRGAYDEGIDYFKNVPHVKEPHVRTYSTVLDGKLDNVKAEVVRLAIPDADVKPIIEGARKTMEKAEHICDFRDTMTNAVTSVSTDIDLKAYEEALKEYRKTLLRYHCTEANADKIIAALQKDIGPLFEQLSGKETTTQSFLYLGTSALNKRIDDYAARLIKWLKNKKDLRKNIAERLKAGKTEEAKALVKEDVEAVTIAPSVTTVVAKGKAPAKVLSATDLAFEGELFRYKVGCLVAKGEYVKARELIWTTCYPEKQTVLSLYLQPIGKELMLAEVNPANWKAIETLVTNKVAAMVAKGAYADATEWLNAYPRIKTYAGVIDAKLLSAAEEAGALGVEAKDVDAAVDATKASAAEAANLADHTDKEDVLKRAGRHLNFDKFNELLEEYRKVLVRNDCTKENADRLVAEFKAALEPLFKKIGEGYEVQTLMLGCNALNDRIAKLVEGQLAEVKRIQDEKAAYEAEMQGYIDELVKRVVALVKEEKYGEARDAIRDAEPVEDPVWNAKRYAVRIGLLNMIVNPRQCRSLAAEIDAKVKEFNESEDYEGLIEYVKKYPYVHDTYQQILDAIAQIKDAMLGLDISKVGTEKYINEGDGSLTARVQEFLEKRDGGLAIPGDLSALEKALADLQEGFVRHYDGDNAVAALCAKFKGEILALQRKELPPMTTYEMNKKLKGRLEASLQGIGAKISAKAYAKLLKDIDAEASFDAQIAMAEDAIARQIGVVCPCAAVELNATMGDYARVVRKLKRGAKVTPEEATTLLVGAVYLNQPAFFKSVLKLGAKINEPAARDPRKRPAMLVAIQSGNVAFLSDINANGGNSKVVDANGNTALHYAMRSGNLSVVKAIFGAVDAKAVNAKGETALFTAARRNQAFAAKFLIELFKGADKDATAELRKEFVRVKNADGQDAFSVACTSNARDVLDVLAKAGAEYGTANLVEAAGADRIAIVEWLVEHEADVNAEGVMAAAFGKPEDEDTATYRYLVRQGGIALKRTPKCCKDVSKKLDEAEKKLKEKQAPTSHVSGTISFEASK